MSRLTLLALALALAPLPAPAQRAPCPAPAEVEQRHLLGLWRAEFADHGPGATLLLEPHPEDAQGLRGAINRNGERALLAGDVDLGELTLEESVNGRNISAVWLGDVVEGSCGREIRGTWQAEGDPRTRSFVLRKR
ncbi:hypothetical protein [Ramlibacter sp.]|uniref:hypothetical protein n=1 Tax=Ramlibacter sp. TaxID=1917967 RepID=UPI002BB0DBBB|nr:hypothetical protein [Ramlibacter sp.]HWI84273.1 hypothetical protein [Ramlibacter sp.]